MPGHGRTASLAVALAVIPAAGLVQVPAAGAAPHSYQYATAMLAATALPVASWRLCIDDTCRSIAGPTMNARELTVTLGYGLRDRARLPTIQSRVGTPRECQTSSEASPSPGVVIAAGGSTLHDRSSVSVRIDGVVVASWRDQKRPATARVDGIEVSLCAT